MKKYILVLFISLFFVSSCGYVKSQQKGPSDGNSIANTGKVDKGANEYPLLATNLLQSEFKITGGKTAKIEDYKGKVLLINLWATWCGPCRMEMPHLVELQIKNKENGFQVLGLNVGDHDGEPEPEAEVKAFAERMNLNYDLGWMNNELRTGLSRIYPLGSIPMSFLISRDGRIRGVFAGAGGKTINSLKEQVEKALTE
jgi:thiol-disulfide isomerase/thioredoxin